MVTISTQAANADAAETDNVTPAGSGVVARLVAESRRPKVVVYQPSYRAVFDGLYRVSDTTAD